jgi:hypothetical protein
MESGINQPIDLLIAKTEVTKKPPELAVFSLCPMHLVHLPHLTVGMTERANGLQRNHTKLARFGRFPG